MRSATYVDAASLEAVLSGLMKRRVSSLNTWEKRGLVDLTTVLLICDEVLLPIAPGTGATLNSHPPDIELIKSILHGLLKEKAPPRHIKEAARAQVDRWLSAYGNWLVPRFHSLWETGNVTDLLHFQMSLTLPYDARRIGWSYR